MWKNEGLLQVLHILLKLVVWKDHQLIGVMYFSSLLLCRFVLVSGKKILRFAVIVRVTS